MNCSRLYKQKILLIPATKTAKKKISPGIIIGVVAAAVAVMFAIAVVMVIKSRKQMDSYAPPYSEYEMKTEKVAMLDFEWTLKILMI